MTTNRNASQQPLVRGRGAAGFQPPLTARQLGIGAEELAGKPSSGSSTPGATSTPATCTCASVPAVKRGVWEAGGYPSRCPSPRSRRPSRSRRRCSTGTCSRWTPRRYSAPTLRRGVLMAAATVHAGAPDGRGEREQADHLRAGRPHAHGSLARRNIGQWHRHVAVLGRKRAGTISEAEWDTLEAAMARSPASA